MLEKIAAYASHRANVARTARRGIMVGLGVGISPKR